MSATPEQWRRAVTARFSDDLETVNAAGVLVDAARVMTLAGRQGGCLVSLPWLSDLEQYRAGRVVLTQTHWIKLRRWDRDRPVYELTAPEEEGR